MYESKKYAVSIFSVFLIVLSVTATTSCCSNTRRIDKAILEYQRQVAILEARNTLYENTVRDCLLEIADVRARAETVEGTIDSLITEFDCYKRAVERMSRYYYETKGEVESVLDYSGSTDGSTDY